jgi:HEAT repeat protein
MEEISKQLESDDVEIRREAVLKLKGIGSGADQRGVIELLITAMQDSSWRVRKTALDILLGEYPIESYITDLVGLLYLEENAGARNSAIEALAQLNKKATPFLIKAFNTPNYDVRKFIIDVIGEFRDKRALPLMLNALKDDDENVRASAVEHLGRIGDSSVVSALIEILEEGDLWTAFPAADALGRIGDRKAMPALINALSRKTLREPALKAIGKLADKNDIKYISPYLDDTSKAVQEEAMKSIELLYRKGVDEDVITGALREQFGDGIIDILLNLAKSSKADIRISAILFLGLLKDERALDPLLELSIEEEFSDDVRRAFVYIGKEKPEALLPLLRKDEPYQRRFILRAAGEVASPLYYDIMASFINDKDGHVRSMAAEGLSNIGDRRAVELIMALLLDHYEDVQEAAVEALSRLKECLDVDSLIASLGDRNPVMRKNIALLLGKIGAKKAVPAIGFALKDGAVSVRRSVVSALSYIKTEDSIKYSILALTDEDPDIRASAAISLGTIGSKSALEPLSLLLNDPDDMVKVAASKALGMLHDARAVPYLIRVLSDKNGFVVATAIDSLGRLGGEESRDALIRMLSSGDKEIRRTAIKSLKNFRHVEVYILPFVKDPDWATRMASVEALGQRPEGNIREELERLLDTEEDPAVKKTIERCINAR